MLKNWRPFAALVAVALVLTLFPPRGPAIAGDERPTQLVATNTAAAAIVGAHCAAKITSPGTGDMLTTAITVGRGVRCLLLSACFEDATTVIVRKTVSGGSAVSMTLNSGTAFTAGCLYSHFAIPVEEGDLINFRLGTANDSVKTRLFKVEGAATR